MTAKKGLICGFRDLCLSRIIFLFCDSFKPPRSGQSSEIWGVEVGRRVSLVLKVSSHLLQGANLERKGRNCEETCPQNIDKLKMVMEPKRAWRGPPFSCFNLAEISSRATTRASSITWCQLTLFSIKLKCVNSQISVNSLWGGVSSIYEWVIPRFFLDWILISLNKTSNYFFFIWTWGLCQRW